MLFSASELDGARLAAIDGAIGEVEDLFFDDQHWTVRYLVVDTGGWLSGRHVLISPGCVRDVDRASHRVIVVLTREQVERSPDVDTHQPISRRQEARLLAHYGMTPYWLGPMAWGPVPLPPAPEPAASIDREILARLEQEDAAHAHLHAAADVVGYQIQARDGELGHVDGFLIDDQAWTIRWLVVDTGTWLTGRKVLVAPEWVDEVAWMNRAVRVALHREQIERAPVYDPQHPVHREYEQTLFEHYGRRSYWDDAA